MSVEFNGSVEGVVEDVGVSVTTEQAWRAMQEVGKFNMDSIDWLESSDILRTDHAKFANRGIGCLNVDHNCADNYGPHRGWRASLKVQKT